MGGGTVPGWGVSEFMGTLASRLVLLPPRDPESKGLVKRRNGWVETSFMPGRGFRSPGDFNTRFSGWLVLGNAPGSAHAQGPPGRSARR